MKKVLVVGPVPPPFGGVASAVEDLIHSDLSRHYVFDVFPRAPNLPPALSGYFRRNLFRLRRFARFLRKLFQDDFCLVHIHSPDQAFLGTIIFTALARLARVPVLLHLHGTDWHSFYPGAPPFRKLYTRIGLRLPQTIFVLYQLWLKEVEKLTSHGNVRVFRNFIHDEAPPASEKVRELRAGLGLREDDFIVLTVGSVGWRKGGFDILDAAAIIACEDRSIKFLLVGGEEKQGELSQLKEGVQKAGLGSSVLLTEEVPRDRISYFFGAANLFLLPSYFEGLPISLLEAMRIGLPIITTPVAGIPEMLTDGVTGVFVTPGAPKEIVRAVVQLKSDPVLRQTLGRKAREHFQENYEFSGAVAQLRSVYQEMEKT